MLKNYTILVLIILSLNVITGLEKKGPIPSVVKLEEGSVHYIYEQKVNIRAKANVKSERVGKAVLGDKVEILKDTGTEEELYKISALWYKVKVNGIVGYLWGGLISTAAIVSDFNNDNKDEMFLCMSYSSFRGMKSINYYNEYMIAYEHEYKYCRGSELISTQPFEQTPLDCNSPFSLKTDGGFQPELSLVVFRWGFGDGPVSASHVQYYYYRGDRFTQLINYESSFGPGQEMKVTLDFPAESKKKNIISYQKTRIILDEETYDEISRETVESFSFKWNGEEFIKQ